MKWKNQHKNTAEYKQTCLMWAKSERQIESANWLKARAQTFLGDPQNDQWLVMEGEPQNDQIGEGMVKSG